MSFIVRYLAGLSAARFILWCYLIWYGVVLVRYFDPNPRLWLTSLGLSFIVGFALYLSATAGAVRVRLERWQAIRLFLMPLLRLQFRGPGEREGIRADFFARSSGDSCRAGRVRSGWSFGACGPKIFGAEQQGRGGRETPNSKFQIPGGCLMMIRNSD
jgi:hypothetical protein